MTTDAKRNHFNAYITPTAGRSTFEIILTLSLIVFLSGALYWTLNESHWLFYGLTVIFTGILYTRLFVIFHDLTHRTLFQTGWVNDLLGSILGVFIMTPFYLWRKSHLIHHREGGNSHKRPWLGDINLLTVKEYLAKPWALRLRYRLYRNPLIMFLLGSIYVFMIDQRRSKDPTEMHPVFGRKEKWAVWGTNLGIFLYFSLIYYFLGGKFLALGVITPLWISGIIGIYLFYVQHNFRNKYYEPSSTWNLQDSAIKGSSFHDIPGWLMWMTANIGYHHVHTLSTRIPFYRLPDCHRNESLFQNPVRIQLRDCPSVLSLKLYDEEHHEMITWKELFERYGER